MYPLLFIGLYYTFIFGFWQLPKFLFNPLFKFALLYCLSVKNAKVVLYCVKFMMLLLLELCDILSMLIIEKSANIFFDNYSDNQNYYPYKRHFYWHKPVECGNILLSDVKFLDIIYQNAGGYFQDVYRVVDAGDNVKNNINNGNKIDEYSLPDNFDSAMQQIDNTKQEYNRITRSVVNYV